jgi:hypothetical protein
MMSDATKMNKSKAMAFKEKRDHILEKKFQLGPG